MTRTGRLARSGVFFLAVLLGLPAAAQTASTSSPSAASGAASTATSGGGITAPSTGGGGDTAVVNPYAKGAKLTLTQCFKAALAGSRSLLTADQRLDKAGVDIRQAWTTFQPRASITGTLTRNYKAVTFAGRTLQPLWQTSAGAQVTENLFDARAIPGLQAVYALHRAQDLNNQELRTDILYGVATAFYSAAALVENVQVAARQVHDNKSHLVATQAKYKVGEVSKVDLLRAEIDVQTAEEDLTAAKAGLASAKLALAILIGRPQGAGDFEIVPPKTPDLSTPAADAAVKKALSDRPDLEAAGLQFDAAQKQVTAAWMEFLPTLGLSWQGRLSQPTAFNPDNFTWNAALTLTIPIYDGGQRYVDIQDADIQATEAKLTRDGLSDQIRKEVLQARLDMRTAAANLQKAQATARLSAENADLVQARFNAGLATSLDVTDASTQRFQSGVDVIRQKLNLDVSMLALARAMGIFDKVAGVPAAGG